MRSPAGDAARSGCASGNRDGSVHHANLTTFKSRPAGAGPALSVDAGATSVAALDQAETATETDVAELVRRSAASNAALMRGDIEKYLGLIAHTDDFTLMSPFGGAPTHGADLSSDRLQAMEGFFRNGTFEQELVQSYGSSDMVALATIERTNVEVGGLPAQDWALRVTLVYRRQDGEWRLAHRHADPLVRGVSLEQAAALAR